ncbi:polypeptide N-acetylgalactosaminyltransferase 11 [Syngnathus scovelli]|uniref:polypeptide N-acetylgalactosaminyltransferase 11 n=1 Tax=Syngnathus scovelli TaxID=161590 RepID=UPI00210FB1AB|nr:polypeptide N-acetylgalactosaminyltransferase 11 [Syngnathus scovelli]XP_049605335.1 polypeptide N-acetylgalactosaminyltransferase 11 [Syngnathus scovelli]
MALVPLRYFCYGCVVTSAAWALLLLVYFSRTADPGLGRNPIGPRRRAVAEGPARQGVGEDAGAAGLLPEMGMIFNQADQEVRDTGYRQHAFNVLISRRIGPRRQLPDTRDRRCADETYPENLPYASVVICFFNEAISALTRTVQSVLDRTPAHLLHEIILVDDHSELAELKDDLDRYVREQLPRNVKLLRNQKREGLIRGRMIGAKHATGEVLVFLDSHCEVNQAWLQPLLAAIRSQRRAVVCPVIDIISADTLAYSPSPVVRGGFNWGLHFKWDPVPAAQLAGPRGAIAPIRSPTMAGGLFAMDRDYFNELGQYDAGMDIWGGENLEISFRIWMCGGELLIIPCSRVGHIFRKRRPYGSPGGHDTMAHNSLRLAHVWMDDYKEHFLSLRPELRERDYGDISQRLALRKRLQCRSFSWYLDNVYPEINNKLQAPPLLSNKKAARPRVLRRGRLHNVASGRCLVAQTRVSHKGDTVVLRPCDPGDPEQEWTYDDEGQLILSGLLCLDMSEVRTADPPRLMKCHGSGGSQQWSLGKSARVYQVSVGQCLSAAQPSGVKGHVGMAICDASLPQQWQLEEGGA